MASSSLSQLPPLPSYLAPLALPLIECNYTAGAKKLMTAFRILGLPPPLPLQEVKTAQQQPEDAPLGASIYDIFKISGFYDLSAFGADLYSKITQPPLVCLLSQ